MSGIYKMEGAPAASTGNNSHAAVNPHPGSGKIALEFNVEAVGATPTVTYAVQGTMVDSPGANDWVPVAIIPSDSDVAAANRVVTAVGRTYSFISQAQVRFFKKIRVVTSANTNVTYSAQIAQELAGK